MAREEFGGGPATDAGGAVRGDVRGASGRGLGDAHFDDRGVGAGGEEGVQRVGHPRVAVDVADHGDDAPVPGRREQTVDQRGRAGRGGGLGGAGGGLGAREQAGQFGGDAPGGVVPHGEIGEGVKATT